MFPLPDFVLLVALEENFAEHAETSCADLREINLGVGEAPEECGTGNMVGVQIFLLSSVKQLWVIWEQLVLFLKRGSEGGAQSRWIYPVGQDELPAPRQSHLQ